MAAKAAQTPTAAKASASLLNLAKQGAAKVVYLVKDAALGSPLPAEVPKECTMVAGVSEQSGAIYDCPPEAEVGQNGWWFQPRLCPSSPPPTDTTRSKSPKGVNTKTQLSSSTRIQVCF